jgi:hypothetical protein
MRASEARRELGQVRIDLLDGFVRISADAHLYAAVVRPEVSTR